MRNSFQEKYAAFVLRNKKLFLGVTLGLTVFFAFYAKSVLTINALENMLPEDDPDLVRYEELKKNFGGDFIMMIVLKSNQLFSKSMLSVVDSMTKDFEKMKEVESVNSITNIPDIIGGSEGFTIAPLVPSIPETDKEMAQLRKKITTDPLYTHYLIRESEGMTAIYVKLKPQNNLLLKQQIRDVFVPQVKEMLQHYQKSADFDYHLAGSPTIEYELDLSAVKNQISNTLLMLGIISVLLIYLFRQFSAVIVCIFTIGLSSLWTTGFIGFLGLPLNFVTSLLPPLILVIAVLDCMHIYALFKVQNLKISADEKIVEVLKHVLVPCLVTGLTTFIGFGSLILSKMQVIRHFGLFASFGILAALFIALGPLPILLTFFPAKTQKTKSGLTPFLEKAVDFFVFLSLKHWKKNLFFASFILFFSLIGFRYINIETKPVDFYPKNSPVARDFHLIDEKFGGSTSADIIVKGVPGSLAEPSNLKMIEDYYAEISSIKDLSAPFSILDFVKKANQALNNGDPTFYRIPETRAAVEQIYLLLESDPHFHDLINTNYSSMRINQQVKAIGTRIGKQVVNAANEVREKTILAPLDSFAASANIVWINMESYIVQSQITGFTCDIVITLVFIFLLRSIKWGLLSMVPNVFPVLCTFGIMGWCGIPLNMVTTMIASISIGLAVDDTVHLMLYIRQATRKGISMPDAITGAFRETGPAVFSTSVILTLGFSSLMASAFLPSRQFGFLGGITFLFALIAELILLPAVLRLFAPYLCGKKKKSMVQSLDSFPLDEVTQS